jgi:hypothetical protein
MTKDYFDRHYNSAEQKYGDVVKAVKAGDGWRIKAGGHRSYKWVIWGHMANVVNKPTVILMNVSENNTPKGQ